MIDFYLVIVLYNQQLSNDSCGVFGSFQKFCLATCSEALGSSSRTWTLLILLAQAILKHIVL